MHDDRLGRTTSSDLTMGAGLCVPVAVGVAFARLTRAVVVDPATAKAARALQMSRRLLPGVTDHPQLTHMAERVGRARGRLEHVAAVALQAGLRRAVEAGLAAIDVTEMVRRHVDLDALAADIDVDAVIARADVVSVIDRIDLDAIVRTIDLDAIVGRLDVEAIVRTVDLDGIVELVDLDRVASRIDLDAIIDRVDVDRVAAGIDLDAIIDRVDVDRVAAGIDLDAIIERVDPDAIVARVDVEAVLARLDLAAIARQVIEAIDLPAILRQSTGAVSSQAARAVRTEGMHADDSVARFIDRVLRRPPGHGAVPA